MSEYRKIASKYAENSTNQRIPNGKKDHAAILIELLFDHAKRDVRIFSGDLCTEVFGCHEVQNATERFLNNPGASLKILIQKEHDESWLENHSYGKFLKEKASDFSGSVSVRQAVGNYSDNINHFATKDDSSFRYETDHNESRAIANFNEPETTTGLNKVFDQAFSFAKPKELFSST
jgi:hypothetical protein